MPIFEYRAIDSKGKKIKGFVDADSIRVARAKLRENGYYPVEVREDVQIGSPRDRVSSRGLAGAINRLLGRVRLQDLSIMTRQLAILVDSGMPVAAALDALADQTENRYLKRVIASVRERVAQGNSLQKSLAEHPFVFSDLYVNMVGAGESTGTLGLILKRLADFIEKQVNLRNKIRATLAYPVFMVFVGGGILFFLITFVIPTVTRIFEETNQALPVPTVVLISISSFMRTYWWTLALGCAILLYFMKRYIRTERGREWFDSVKLRIPLYGAILKRIALSRFARTLATALCSGIPILVSMDIVSRVVNNKVIEKAIMDAKVNLREGGDLASPLERSGVFPPMISKMIAIGESSGELESMLNKVADAYDNEVEAMVTGLTSMLEPVMIMVMGFVVGFIVLAILLPIFEMSQIVS